MQGQAKNVIVFLGDGMSLATVTAARILDGQRKGHPGEENQLAWETFPATALSKTYNTDAQTPDSAGTMTAIATGVKTHIGAIGVSAGRHNDCAQSLDHRLQSWLALAADAGMGTGIRSEEHTSELQSLMRISYAVFCLKKKITKSRNTIRDTYTHSSKI